MHAVYRQSLRSTGYISNSKLFQAMFPDSSIAKDFSLSAVKLSYIVKHGLDSYFKNQIMRELVSKGPRLPPKFLSCFDESFNQTTLSKQMDIHIIYFDKESQKVKRAYIGSQFMGHVLVYISCLLSVFIKHC